MRDRRFNIDKNRNSKQNSSEKVHLKKNRNNNIVTETRNVSKYEYKKEIS
jgi:hypothetical protein